jgi:uncharacterized protein YoxC
VWHQNPSRANCQHAHTHLTLNIIFRHITETNCTMEFAEIPASDPLVSHHPDDTRAAAIPAGNGIPADAVDEARKECGKRQLLRETGDGVTPEELRSSKRRLLAVRTRDIDVHYGGGLPLGNDGAAIVQALTALTASVNALTDTVNGHTASINALTDTVNGHTASINALTATVNANHTTATNNHTTATNNHAALTATVIANHTELTASMHTMAIRVSNNQKVQHRTASLHAEFVH